MSDIGKRLKILRGEHEGKIGVVVREDETIGKKILRLENGAEIQVPMWSIGMLEWVDFDKYHKYQ